MNANINRVMKVYTDTGFNLDGHSFKAVGKNQVRVTIRTYARIYKDSRYTINLFCDPLIRAGFKVVRYTTKAAPIPTIIVCELNSILENAKKRKGTLSILVQLPEERSPVELFKPMPIRAQYKQAYSIVRRVGDFATYNTLCSSYGIDRKIREYAFQSFYNSEL